MKTRLLIIPIVTVLSIFTIIDVYAVDLTQIQKMERVGCVYYTEWCDEVGIGEDEFYFIWTSSYEVSNIEMSSDKTLEQVLARCTISDTVEQDPDLIWFYNSTHYIDNDNCQWGKSLVCGDNEFRVGNSCKTMYQNPDLDPKLLSVLGSCHSQFNNEINDLMIVSWQNNTHFIDNVSCQWQYPNQCNDGDFLSTNKCHNSEKGIVPPSPKYMDIKYCGAVRDVGCNGEFIFEKNIDVNYVDFRDASGELIEVGCSIGLRASPDDSFGSEILLFFKCNLVSTLILVLVLIGIGVGIILIVWRKRK